MEKIKTVIHIESQQDWNNALQVLEDNGIRKRTWGAQICFRPEYPCAMSFGGEYGWSHCTLDAYKMSIKKWGIKEIISYEEFMDRYDKLNVLNNPVGSLPTPDGSGERQIRRIKNVRKVKVIKKIPSKIKYQGRIYLLE